MDADNPDEFYRTRIAEEIAGGEPELEVLSEFVRPGSVAVDVGANTGIFAYALSTCGVTVHAFEANPTYAQLAARMLGDRATMHEVALSAAPGRATFRVPLAEDGSELHFGGSLKVTHTHVAEFKTFDVELRTLDSYGFSDVSFLKVDVEGSEPDVLEGGAATIARERPILLMELLAGTFENPLELTRQIAKTYRYDAQILHRGEFLAAEPVIESLGKNTTWGTDYASRNVIFRPK